MSVAPSQRYILGNLHPPVLGKGDFANVNGYSIMNRDQCGLRTLNQMTSAIIGDTQHTGKQGEALSGRKKKFIGTFSTPGVPGRDRKDLLSRSLGKSQLPNPQALILNSDLPNRRQSICCEPLSSTCGPSMMWSQDAQKSLSAPGKTETQPGCAPSSRPHPNGKFR